MKRLALLCVTLLLAACNAPPQDIEQQIRAREQLQVQAAMGGDRATLETIFAADFRMISPTGAVADRDELLGLLAGGNPPYRKAVYDTDSVVVLGDAAVVTTGTESVEYAADGRPQQRRVTQVWRRYGNDWRLMLRQATLVEPAAPTEPPAR